MWKCVNKLGWVYIGDEDEEAIFRLGNLFHYAWMDGEHHGREDAVMRMREGFYDCD